MKLLKYLTFTCMILFPAFAPAQDQEPMSISLIQGDVQISGPDFTDWTAASINLPLYEGDRIWVPDGGRLETHIRGGVFIRADENTAYDVLSLGGGSMQLYLDRGHVYINNRRGGIKTVQADTPLASIRSYDNSIIMLDVTDSGHTEVSVLTGEVYAETKAGATRIIAGNTLTIREDNTAELSPIAAPDDWERWNMDRDGQIMAYGESSRYLPGELQEYSTDFDENGRWDYTSDYGYVWVPAITVVEWAPYTVGRWIWVRNNYVWISFETWGWAPYHYGRWVHVPARGWCWVPPSRGAVYWGPGFVGWVYTPAYVAWVPLAPGEIYYGYGYYGPGSINITTININTVVVNKRYRNSAAAHAVTVVRRDSFGTGMRVPVKLKENPFDEIVRQRRPDVKIVPPHGRPEKRIMLSPREIEREREHIPAVPPAMKRGERQAMPSFKGRAPEQNMPPERIVRPEERKAPQTVPAVPRGVERPERRAVPPAVERPEQRAIPPYVGRVPEKRLPPESVRKIRPEELKNERPLVRDRNASVFKPQPPENLPVRKQNEPRVITRKQAPTQQPQIMEQPQPKQKEKREGGPRRERE